MTGDEARALRQGLRLSARELALELGVSAKAIYRWEKREQREVPRMYSYALRYVVNQRAQHKRDDDDDDPAEAFGE
jgi:transcriptional regulator with XRE-family HTH domain